MKKRGSKGKPDFQPVDFDKLTDEELEALPEEVLLASMNPKTRKMIETLWALKGAFREGDEVSDSYFIERRLFHRLCDLANEKGCDRSDIVNLALAQYFGLPHETPSDTGSTQVDEECPTAEVTPDRGD